MGGTRKWITTYNWHNKATLQHSICQYRRGLGSWRAWHHPAYHQWRSNMHPRNKHHHCDALFCMRSKCYILLCRWCSGVVVSTTPPSTVENDRNFPSPDEIRLIPNPSNGRVAIQGNFSEDALVTIYSLTGVQLLEFRRYDTTALNFLAVGVYIVRIGNQSTVLVKQE